MSRTIEPMTITGSCACGKIRFTSNATPRDTCYCYCTTCRKSSGAPYIAFTHFRQDQVKWETTPDVWHSSSIAYRTFCMTCSSNISMIYKNDRGNVAIAVGCIDDGVEAVPPVSMCIFIEEKPAWAELPEGVRQYIGFPNPVV